MGKQEPEDINASLQRIEAKIDRLLYLLGEGRPRSTAEIGRIVEHDMARLRERQALKEERKKEAERRGKKE